MDKTHCKGDIHCFEGKETCDCGKKSCNPQEPERCEKCPECSCYWNKSYCFNCGYDVKNLKKLEPKMINGASSPSEMIIKFDKLPHYYEKLAGGHALRAYVARKEVLKFIINEISKAVESRNEEIKAEAKKIEKKSLEESDWDWGVLAFNRLLEFLNKK